MTYSKNDHINSTLRLDDQTNAAIKGKWRDMFLQLQSFKSMHGHCLVPNRYGENPALGSWVSIQRHQYKLMISQKPSSMTNERVNLLDSIGFQWSARDPRHVPWETRYEELLRYKRDNGNCLVPIGYEKNVQLSNWVSTQRQQFKLLINGKPSRLTKERAELLNWAGFVWEANRGGKKKSKKSLRYVTSGMNTKKYDTCQNLVTNSSVGNCVEHPTCSVLDKKCGIYHKAESSNIVSPSDCNMNGQFDDSEEDESTEELNQVLSRISQRSSSSVSYNERFFTSDTTLSRKRKINITPYSDAAIALISLGKSTQDKKSSISICAKGSHCLIKKPRMF